MCVCVCPSVQDAGNVEGPPGPTAAPPGELHTQITAKLIYSNHLWAIKKVVLYTSSLFTEVKMNGVSSYKVVLVVRWSLDASVWFHCQYTNCIQYLMQPCQRSSDIIIVLALLPLNCFLSAASGGRGHPPGPTGPAGSVSMYSLSALDNQARPAPTNLAKVCRYYNAVDTHCLKSLGSDEITCTLWMERGEYKRWNGLLEWKFDHWFRVDFSL